MYRGRTTRAGRGAAIGAVAGAAFGAIFGYPVQTGDWEEVDLNRLQVDFAWVDGGGFSVVRRLSL